MRRRNVEINEDDVLLSLPGGGRSEKILHKSCIEIQEKLKIFQAPNSFFSHFGSFLESFSKSCNTNPAQNSETGVERDRETITVAEQIQKIIMYEQ